MYRLFAMYVMYFHNNTRVHMHEICADYQVALVTYLEKRQNENVRIEVIE
jgi:hypothetical protein